MRRCTMDGLSANVVTHSKDGDDEGRKKRLQQRVCSASLVNGWGSDFGPDCVLGVSKFI